MKPVIRCPQCGRDKVKQNGTSRDGKTVYYKCLLCTDPHTHEPTRFAVKRVDPLAKQ